MFGQMTFIIDIDGTLCPIKAKHERYEDLVPYADMIKKIRFYKDNGAKIVLYTSRNMNSYQGNIGLINANTAKIILAWLDKWEIPYDEIIYGKPWPGHEGFYVDDRAVRPNEFINCTPEELKKICEDSRMKNTYSDNNQLDLVITMAGLGSRFREAGYSVPKYMIEACGKTLFEWSMDSLSGYLDMVSQCIFIVRKEDQAATFIEAMCDKSGITRRKIIEIDYLTDGQATTAMLASDMWNPEHGLLIYNIDTYVEPGQMKYSDLKGDGFIPCFYGKGNHWSFVKLAENGKAVEVREKERISDYCTLGAYYFSSCALYETLYKEYYSQNENLEKGEKYVAPLYNYLISKGKSVYISVVEDKAVHVLGTPEELAQFKQGYKPK